MRAWFSAHMSASVQLEPPADRAGGDAPVGLLDPTHVFGIQAFSSSSRSQGRVPGVGSGGGDEGLHQRRSRCMQLGCWRELPGSAEVVGVGVGVGVWQPSLLCIKGFKINQGETGPIGAILVPGEKISKNLLSLSCASVWAIRQTGAVSSAHPSHPIPPRARDLGICGVATYTVQTQQGIGLFSRIPAGKKPMEHHQDQTGPLCPSSPHRSVEKGMALDGGLMGACLFVPLHPAAGRMVACRFDCRRGDDGKIQRIKKKPVVRSAIVGDIMATASGTGKSPPRNMRRDDDASDVCLGLHFLGRRSAESAECRCTTKCDEQCLPRLETHSRLLPRPPHPRQAGAEPAAQGRGQASPNRPRSCGTLADSRWLPHLSAPWPPSVTIHMHRQTTTSSQPCNHRPSVNHPSIAPAAGVRDNSTS